LSYAPSFEDCNILRPAEGKRQQVCLAASVVSEVLKNNNRHLAALATNDRLCPLRFSDGDSSRNAKSPAEAGLSHSLKN